MNLTLVFLPICLSYTNYTGRDSYEVHTNLPANILKMLFQHFYQQTKLILDAHSAKPLQARISPG